MSARDGKQQLKKKYTFIHLQSNPPNKAPPRFTNKQTMKTLKMLPTEQTFRYAPGCNSEGGSFLSALKYTQPDWRS